jgi:hypothetical protein
MPNRIIREGILTSERVDSLDAPAEVFYRRLMSKVDDHGLYDARPSILRSSLFPLRVDRVREADITRWIAACEKAGVIALYSHDGKPLLQMLDTRWQARSEPKYPLPTAAGSTGLQPPDNSCAQVIASAPVFVVGVEDVDVTPKAPKGAGGRFEKFWGAYPNKVGKDAARRAFEKRKPDDALLAQMLSAIDAQKASAKWAKDGGQYIPNPATWLTQGRWQDGAAGDGSPELGEWHETRAGVDSKARSLGMPEWDEIEQWVFFKARVIQAAKEAA